MAKSISVQAVLLAWQWKADGTNFFRIRLTLNRQKKYIKTNVQVRRDQVGRNGLPKEPTARRLLEDEVRKIEGIVRTFDSFALDGMTLDAVVRRIEREIEGAFRLDFPTFALETISGRKRSSRDGYASALNSLKEFAGKGEIDISEITSSFLRRWTDWLEVKHGAGARAVSCYPAAIRYLHGRARAQFNDEENGYVPISNPFQYYHPPVQRQAPHRAVKTWIIEKMLSLRETLEGRERTGVDIFLISFAMMGMNSPDMYEAREAVGGIVTYFRQKTTDRRSDRAEMHVRMEDCAMALFREYAGHGRLFRFSEMYSSYKVMGSNVNIGLRKFKERIGYTGKLTLYTARHTWATVAYRTGIDKGVVNDCICHVDREMKVTDLYIDKDWSVVWEANRKVLGNFSWPVCAAKE